ncbi:MAG: type II secretion system protein [Candidatus Paceibacterota bacterium]|jgi:prepilin-type N-terminal cleavage/methylation domain-containing protein
MRKNAFTLVELLIVIAIIGVFTAVLFGSIASSRANSRDHKRIIDMKQIQIGLALYFDINREYPRPSPASEASDVGSLAPLVTQRFLPLIPADPTVGATYEYFTSGLGRKYCVGVKLENVAGAPSENACSLTKPVGSVANYWGQNN